MPRSKVATDLGRASGLEDRQFARDKEGSGGLNAK